MGRNVDLVQTLGLEPIAICPKCNKPKEQMLTDYAMGPTTNIHPGEWNLWYCCPECEHEWEIRMKVSITALIGPFQFPPS